MSDQVMTVTIKGVGDFSDVVNNVGSVQKALTKLKLPDKLGDSLNKNITAFYREYEKYQKKMTEGVKTQGDYNQVEKSLNNMRSLYQAIGKDAQKLTQLDMKDMLNLDTGEFKKIMNELTSVIKQIGSVKIDTAPFNKAFADIRNITKNSKITGDNGLLNQIIGSVNTGQIAQAKKQLQELENYAKRVAPRTTESGARMPGTLSTEKYQQLTAAIDIMNKSVTQAEAAMNPLIEKQNDLQRELDETKQKAAQGIKKEFDGYNQASNQVENLTESLKRMHQEEFSFNREAQNIDRQIQSYFGLSQMIRKVGDIARDAFATVKELDAAMTQTAVVTNFDVGDMWDMLPTYTAQANQLGSTIKDVYEAATLYYQQGLNTNQAMGLANETLKMARIAGLDAAEATNMMTAALRGFNMEINQASAQKINDIYSELAAITASDTKEIGSAMERTASIANAANMDFATTSAFLAQMIETTREAPENLGTAMKTIVARFQEMKQDPTKLVDSEGVAMDVNKVDKALKTIGVSLTNTKGEFRDLDDVFLDISSKWDSLSQGQQRYIATIAAGSRQQSRFIAMMSDYERTMELVDAANNSAGASQRQFEKTLDSMEAKLNMLKNAWDQFTMGLMNNQILKFGVDALTEGFTIVNKFIDILGKLPPKPFEGITKSVLTLVTTLGMLQFGKKASRGLVMGGAAWWKGEEGGFGKNFMSGFSGQAAKAGTADGQIYAKNFNNAIKAGQFKNAFQMTKDRAAEIKNPIQYANTFQAAFGQFSAKELSSGWSTQIESEIRNAFIRASASVDASIWGEEDGNEYINGLIAKMRSGEMSAAEAANSLHLRTQGQADVTNLGVNALPTEEVDKLGNSLTKAGTSLQTFGMALQDTPLAPFGALLSKIGMLTSGFGETAGKAMSIFKKGMEGTAVAEAEVGAGATAMAAGETTATAATAGLAGGFKALGTAILEFLTTNPVGWLILAVAGVVAAYKMLDLAIVSNAEKLEAVTDAAAAASEAYDSAKQETSELADAIEQIKTNEDAFDGLVVGTAAFNEQLVNANEQIMELIKKYPMLIDADKNYVTTDKNGLMHISDEGLEAVKEYQKQRQANASALNLIQTADLNSEETRQKAEQMRKVKGTDTTETLKQRQQEADLLEQQAKAQADMAKVNAVNTALVDKEIHNREKVSAIMAEQYDARKNAVNLEGESIHDLKQEYADFYGYKYDKSTKKLTDVEGNEIDVDKATVEDAVKEIRVITNFEADGKSLDSMLNSIDSKFSDALGDTFADSGNLFSDIMSNNIDINGDLLENLITNPDKLQNAVDALSEKEIAAVLGVSAEAVEQAPNIYKDELTDKLTERATNIVETQAQSYTELASMLAQTVGTSVIDGNGDIIAKISEGQKQAVTQQLEKLTTEQKNTLSSIGNALSEGAGAETMRAFIKQATDIYTSGVEQSITDLDNIIQGVNWDSPTARLKAYNDMIADGVDPSVQNLGQSLLDSTDSANLLGEAFEEFYDSNDFQEMAENMDKFADSSGKLNASSVQEMAKECGSLNNLLDSGAISAGGVAAALNAMGADGNVTILDLNENLLKFLSTANQLDDVLSEAHSLIENFDWGVDTGESEDFAIDSTKKWNELYDNGEFGNQQLENYAKFVLGQERWNDELEHAGGNIETALANIDKDISIYSDGFMDSWREMADSTDERYADIHRGDNGDIIWETNGRTTEQMVQDLAKARNITEDWAKLMLEDFVNYSYDLKTELASNDYVAALKNGDYIEAHKGADNTTNITQSEVAALAAAQNKTEEEILTDIQKYGKISEDELNVIKNIDENGNLLMGSGDIKSLNEQYSQRELGEDTTKSWISQYQARDSQGQVIEGSTDLKNAISGAIADGLPDPQATEMARTEALQALEDGAQVFYDGVELHKEDLEDSQAFADRIAEITDNSRWTAVGEAIAQGYLAYIKGGETPDTNPSSDTNDYYSNGGKEGGSSSTSSGSFEFSDGAQAEADLRADVKAKAQQDYKEWLQGIKDGAQAARDQKTFGSEADQAAREATRAQLEKLWASVKEAFTSGKEVEDPKIAAAEKAKENWKSIWEKVKEAFSTTPKVEPNTGGATNGGQESSKSAPQTTNQNLSVTYTGEVANPDELKASLESQITSILNQVTAQTQKMQTSVSVTVNYKKGEQAKAKKQTTTVDYKRGKQDKAEDKEAKVNYTLGSQAAPTTKTATVNYTLGSVPTVPTQYATLKLNLSESSKKFNVVPAFKGLNNKIVSSTLPSLGSLAKGTKSRYGQVGPRNNGGLTLTGEKGFEIAWIPSENRSMIVGANGPQMLNLPKDAVVWTHEQSKKILKQKSIPAGSHGGRHDPASTPTTPTEPNIIKTKPGSTPVVPKSDPKVEKEQEKLINKAGKVVVWWDNQARKVDKVTRLSEKNQKQFDKVIKTANSTINEARAAAIPTIKELNKSLKLNNQSLARASKELNILDKGSGKGKKVTTYKKPKEGSKGKDVAQLEKALIRKGAAKGLLKTADKTFDKDTTKAIKNFQSSKAGKKAGLKATGKLDNKTIKALGLGKKFKQTTYKGGKKLVENGGSWAEISYEMTKKTKDKNNKTKKTKETKNTKVDLSKYITKDSTGAYVIDQDQIDKIAQGYTDKKGKKHKGNKSKAKSIVDAANKAIDDKTKKKETAEDNIDKANEAIEKIGQDIYDTFFGWKNELTKVYNLTQKIEIAEKRIANIKGGQDLIKARIASGKLTAAEGKSGFKTLIKGEIAGLVNQIKAGSKLINAQKDQVKRAVNYNDNTQLPQNLKTQRNKAQDTISDVNAKLTADKKYDTAKANQKKVKTDEKQIKAAAKIAKKKSTTKISLKELKNAKKEKQKELKETKDKKKQASLKKEIKVLDTGIAAKKSLKADKKANKKTKKDLKKYANSNLSAKQVKKLNSKKETAQAKKAELKAEQKTYEADKAVREKAKNYSKVSYNKDGTVNLEIDYDKIERDRVAGKITGDEASKMTEYLEGIQDENSKLLDAYNNQTDNLTNLYQSLADLKEQQADHAKELFDQYVENQRQAVENTKILSNTISDTFKDLIDTVKSNLDARRQAEDNAKTEQDISKKQQRLAMLRADTSSGHQVEIGQLQKEIAEAQQSYGRTLEDQTLDKLSQQNDAAQKQRERQIALAEAQVDLNVQNGTYAKHIDELLANPNTEQSVAEMTALWNQMIGAEGLPKIVQENAKAQIEANLLDVQTYQTSLQGFDTAIGATKTNLETLEQALASAAKEITTFATTTTSANFSGKKLENGKGQGAAYQKAASKTAKQVQKTVNKKGLDQNTMAHVKATVTKSNGKKETGQINSSGTKVAAAKGSTLEVSNWDTKKGEQGKFDKSLTVDKFTEKTANSYPAEVKEALKYAVQHKKPGTLLNKNWEALIKKTKLASNTGLKLNNGNTGYIADNGDVVYASSKKDGVYRWKPGTGKLNFEAYKKADFVKKAKYTNVGAAYKAILKRKGVKGYATGGLADFTGPAWLDGTPSKPELVLNPTDTKNFLALKDVLGKAMSSASAVENTYGGDAMYEININVDKIEKDYDVDRVVEKVKKEITKGAGYRNVTQVRNFR